jgi:hypothetical protein
MKNLLTYFTQKFTALYFMYMAKANGMPGHFSRSSNSFINDFDG